MHAEDLSAWTHEHNFDAGNAAAERGTRLVMWITAAMMVIEISAGWWFNSMALLADGLHMSSHAVAIGLSTFAYAAARHLASDARFAFGTWKIEVLAGFASAIVLMGVAILMLVGSVERMIAPQPIQYQEATVIALVGLFVNIACALILGRAHHHDHGEGHGHGHGESDEQGHHDLNLRSAYLHVMADAATSVLAVIALLGGWIHGWSWLDPMMGIVGAVLVGVWARGLIIDTSRVLLDREMDHPVVAEIREAVEADGEQETRITDLHVWRVGRGRFSCAMTVVTHDRELTPDDVRVQLRVHDEIVHTTIEVQYCPA